jgi:hypothetical protein
MQSIINCACLIILHICTIRHGQQLVPFIIKEYLKDIDTHYKGAMKYRDSEEIIFDKRL